MMARARSAGRKNRTLLILSFFMITALLVLRLLLLHLGLQGINFLLLVNDDQGEFFDLFQ